MVRFHSHLRCLNFYCVDGDSTSESGQRPEYLVYRPESQALNRNASQFRGKRNSVIG